MKNAKNLRKLSVIQYGKMNKAGWKGFITWMSVTPYCEFQGMCSFNFVNVRRSRVPVSHTRIFTDLVPPCPQDQYKSNAEKMKLYTGCYAVLPCLLSSLF